MLILVRQDYRFATMTLEVLFIINGCRGDSHSNQDKIVKQTCFVVPLNELQ